MKIQGGKLTYDIANLIADLRAKYVVMSPVERETMLKARCESFVYTMRPCEHGVADFEQCEVCRRKAGVM